MSMLESLNRREAVTITSAVAHEDAQKAIVYRERVVLGWLQYADTPPTSGELAASYYWHTALCHKDQTGARLHVRRALSGLKAKQRVRHVEGGNRRCAVTGIICATWEAVPA